MTTNTPCTLLIRYANQDTNKEEWRRVVLKDVLWESKKGITVITSGLILSNSIVVYIPFNVDSNGLKYILPNDYALRSSSEINSYWTLNTDSRMIKGIADITTPINSITNIIKQYNDVFTIKSVDTFDYGSADMQHWEVNGN